MVISSDIYHGKGDLVSFHLKFSRWCGLPDGIGVGSIVQAQYGIIGQKSEQIVVATIIETNFKAFGLRIVKVRFHNNDLKWLNRLEHFVPTDWIVVTTRNAHVCYLTTSASLSNPIIHMIVNQESRPGLCMRDVSRYKD